MASPPRTPNPQCGAPYTAALRPAAAQPEHGYRNQETGGKSRMTGSVLSK